MRDCNMSSLYLNILFLFCCFRLEGTALFFLRGVTFLDGVGVLRRAMINMGRESISD